MISAETACWDMERKNLIFNEDFYLPLYLPLWLKTTHVKNNKNIQRFFLVKLLRKATIVVFSYPNPDRQISWTWMLQPVVSFGYFLFLISIQEASKL
jgi:hypothetical protein